MTACVRPRRSVLYMPGLNPRALDKAKALTADGLILDLEDAVAPDQKAAARQAVVNAVKAGGYGPREVVIRVNGLASAWGSADLEAAATAGADAVLLPKVESADAVRQALAMLGGAGAPEGLRLWCMMETPRAMLRAEEIAGPTRGSGKVPRGPTPAVARLVRTSAVVRLIENCSSRSTRSACEHGRQRSSHGRR